MTKRRIWIGTRRLLRRIAKRTSAAKTPVGIEWTDERWFAHVNASLVPDPEDLCD